MHASGFAGAPATDNRNVHGFSADADFGFLRGLTVEQICLGQYQTQIHFNNGTSMSMEGRYVHQMPSGNRQVDQPPSSCGPNELFRLLGAAVISATVISPDTLRVHFSNGDILLLMDKTDLYESFQFRTGDLLIIV